MRRVVRRVAWLSDQIAEVQQSNAQLRSALEAIEQKIDTTTGDQRAWREIFELTPAPDSWDTSRPPRPRLAALDEIRDSIHLVVRRHPPHRPVRVLFLAHLIETWDSYDAIVRAMQAAPDFDPVVATIPHHFNGDGTAVGEAEVSRGLDARGVPHVRFSNVGPQTLRTIKYLEPDVIFRQSQWDFDIPEPLGVDHLTFARLCLMPYEPMNIVENVPDPGGRDPGFDSDLHRAAWAVFCANDMVRDRARQRNLRTADRFFVVGHPKVDRLRRVEPRWPIVGPRDNSRIVWSAHHTVAEGWTSFGMFPVVADDMLAWAEGNPDIDILFSAHPALLAMFTSPQSAWEPGRMQVWLERWQRLPNTGVLRSADYMPALAASDLLISDGLSLLAEYQVLNKPVIFLERDGHRPFNELGEIVRSGIHAVSSVKDARVLVDQLLAEGDLLAERQREVVDCLFGSTELPAADRVLDVLRELLAAERTAESG